MTTDARESPEHVAAAITGGANLPDVIPPPTTPMAVARELLLERSSVDGCPLLARWRGDYYWWDGAHWVALDAVEIEAWLYKRLENAQYMHVDGRSGVQTMRPWRPKRSTIQDVMQALAAITLLPGAVESPSWQGGAEAAPADRLVACQNGLLEVPGRKLHPLTPAFFNTSVLPFNYQSDAPVPLRWLTFLSQVFADDAEAISALQEAIGYLLSGRTNLQKIFLMVGPPRSGKGTIARIVQALIGRANCTGSTLASLATNFGLQPLIGRSLAVVADARISARTDVSQITERLLSISGEDTLTIDRKHRESWTGKLPTRFLILSNELPRLGDASGAIASRFIVLSMATSFRGREDPDLTDRLLAELPGIFNWGLDGLDRLTERGYLVAPKSSQEAVEDLQDLTSPVSAFIRDCCELTGEVEAGQLFRAWSWLANSNGLHPGSAPTFGRDLRAARPELKVIRPREGEERIRKYVGLSLTPPNLPGPVPGPQADLPGPVPGPPWTEGVSLETWSRRAN